MTIPEEIKCEGCGNDIAKISYASANCDIHNITYFCFHCQAYFSKVVFK